MLPRYIVVYMWFRCARSFVPKAIVYWRGYYGWGIAEVAIMINTVAVYAYWNDCFPRRQGEISALVNLARTLGGFSVAYFQVPWATKHGAFTGLWRGGCHRRWPIPPHYTRITTERKISAGTLLAMMSDILTSHNA